MTPRDTQPQNTLSEEDGAQYLGMSKAWLRKQRRFGAGPAYVRLGRRIVYMRSDLDALIQRGRIDPARAR